MMMKWNVHDCCHAAGSCMHGKLNYKSIAAKAAIDNM